MFNQSTARYQTNSPETRAQAEQLLKQYYKDHRADLPDSATRPILESWKLDEETGILTVVDGTSGRKIDFVILQQKLEALQAEIQTEDAEQTALDAETEVVNLRAQLVQAEAKAKQAREAAVVQAKAEAKAKKEADEEAKKAEARNAKAKG